MKKIREVVVELVEVKPEIVFVPVEERKRVRARSLLKCQAVCEPGINMTNLSKVLNISLSALSAAVERWEKLAVTDGDRLREILNM